MKHFTIRPRKQLCLPRFPPGSQGNRRRRFSTAEQFADAIGNDNKRFLEIWNSLLGVKPVSRFANRKLATERIWKRFGTSEGRRNPLLTPKLARPNPMQRRRRRNPKL
jgi:hypothetical protein